LSDVTQKQTTDNDFLDIPPVSLIRRARLFHSGIIMRRSALQAVNGYDETRKNLLDADLWIRLAKQGSRLGLMSPRLFYRRIHAGQHFERKKRLSYLWAGFQVRWRAVQLFSQSPLDAFWPCLALLYGLLPVNLRNYLYSWWFMR
jgi:GT2 family glycosyltransferase